MQAIDFKAIETLKLPRILLMDHAGLAVARQTAKLIPHPQSRVVILCGRGYNGGDGLAAGRHLAGWGYPVLVALVGSTGTLRDEPKAFAEHLKCLGVSIIEPAEEKREALRTAMRSCDIIIDALLGIGASGPLREPYASLIGEINQTAKKVVAVDLPSGLDGDTGQASPAAVKATVTVALGRIKRGCTLAEGPSHAGKLIADAITFPDSLLRVHA